jgi:ubiquitin C-terminal hydrolase
MFIKTARLLAQPVSSELLELCELRNILLNPGFVKFRFLSPKQLRISEQHQSFSFFGDYGHPNVSISNNISTYFWPDEWEQVLGGDDSIGHFIQIYKDDKNAWVEGEVISFNKETNLYKILLDKPKSIAINDETTKYDPYNGEDKYYYVNLSLPSVFHFWTDLSNKHRLKTNLGQIKIKSSPLSFSDSDVGLFIRVFWSRYQKYFYGRIIEFDTSNNLHSIVYEDGDVRKYDITTKQYQVIFPPKTILDQVDGDDNLSKLVSAWHIKLVSPIIDVPASTDENHKLKDSIVINRPRASQGHNTSIHHVYILNAFFNEGGAESMFQSLCDPSQPPPMCRLIVLHLQCIHQLRRILNPSYFSSLVWEAKEGVPFALLRFESAHFKNLTLISFQEIFILLKDLVLSASPESKNISEELDYLRLGVSSKLLSCSQLQKRYLGLSMIKDVIEAVLPKASSFIAKRVGVLSSGNKNVSSSHTEFGRDSANNSFHYKYVLSSKQVEDWLIKNNVIEEIFGASFHQDLAGRSDIVLVFMSYKQCLTEQHIDSVWQSSKGAHEAVIRVIHHLILVIIPVLETSLRMHILNILSSIPYKDYSEQTLRLIKSFTVQVMLANKDDNVSTTSSHVTNIENNKSINRGENVTNNNNSPSSSSNRKGLVVNVPQRQWMGFGLLWQFVQDPVVSGYSEGIDENLIDIAITLLVELLQEEFKDERDLVMQRCLDNIQMGITVPVSLQVLRRTLALYPTPSRGWFAVVGSSKGPTISSQIEKLEKQNGLLTIVFADLERYHNTLIEQTNNDFSKNHIDVENSSLNNKRIQIKGKIGRSSHLKGVTERLDFLKFIISKSNIFLKENQITILWKALGECAVTVETMDKLVIWLDSLISKDSKSFFNLLNCLSQESDPSNPSLPSKLSCLSPSKNQISSSYNTVMSSEYDDELYSAFEEGALIKLFELHIIPWASSRENISITSRAPVAILCLKLFLLVNITNKGIKVDVGGTWIRQGPLSGLSLLWRIVVDSKDRNIANVTMCLIIELHHRVNPKFKNSDMIRGHLLRVCFRQLSKSIQSLREGDDEREIEQTVISSTPSLSASISEDISNDPLMANVNAQVFRKPSKNSGSSIINEIPHVIEEWFDDGDILLDSDDIARRISRYVLTLRLFIQRFHQTPIQLISIQVLAGKEENPVVTLSMKSTDTIGQLRIKVAEHFKEPTSVINMLKHIKSSSINIYGDTIERLDKDYHTLSYCKFLAQDSIIARKNELNEVPNKSQQPEVIAADIITPSVLNMIDVNLLKPLSWLAPKFISSSSNYDRNGEINEKENSNYIISFDLELSLSSFTLPMSPFDAQDVQKNNQVEDKNKAVSDYIVPFIQNSPYHIEQLLEILDGYLSMEITGVADFDLSADVWDLLQSLPIHPILLKQVQNMPLDDSGGAIRRMLDFGNPYRILYVLQIIDSFLSGEKGKGKKLGMPCSTALIIAEWSRKFLYVGGADHIISLLNTSIDNINSFKEVSNMKKINENYFKKKSVSRIDASVLVQAMLHRLLHRLLLLDPSYKCYQEFIQTDNSFHSGDINHETKKISVIPPCLVLSCLKVPELVHKSLASSLLINNLFLSNVISSSTLLALVENSLLLLLGLLISYDDGIQILKSYSDLNKWIQTFCMKNNSLEIRQGTCRRIFNGCSILFLLCATGTMGQEKKKTRLELFDYLYYCVVVSLFPTISTIEYNVDDESSNFSLNSSKILRSESFPDFSSSDANIINLIGAIQGLRSNPDLIFENFIKKGSSNMKKNHPVTPTPPSSPIKKNSNRELNFNVDTEILCCIFVEKLMNHKSEESFHSSLTDFTLVSILRVLLMLATGEKSMRRTLGSIEIQEVQDNSDYKLIMSDLVDVSFGNDLISFLYVNCLFPRNIKNVPIDEDSPKNSTSQVKFTGAVCQTNESRNLSYELLLELCKCDELNFSRLMSTMNELKLYSSNSECSVSNNIINQNKNDNKITEILPKQATAEYSLHWDYDPSALMKDVGAYVGLVNQGGTCYMNSFLQQLYHIPAFSNEFLKISSINGQVGGANEILLFQLQVLFGYLRLSQKSYYNTLSFCKSFIDYTGEPISLSEQKDINEFAGMLFDKLESNTECKNLLSETIQGKLVWKNRSIETPYKSDREEDFYMLTAEVKDKANIEDSLDLFVAEELFSGDNKIEDPDAGRKVDTLRRCVIRDLPSTLIIHLKRFEFDLETLDRKKLNDLITFPTELNMLPYTEEGIMAKENKMKSGLSEEDITICGQTDSESIDKAIKPADYYQFELKGVVAHVGAIDRGHYYSFIKERTNDKWLEFNDRNVLPFSEESIPLECFGGEETNSTGGITRMRQNNAYLLFYERKTDTSNSFNDVSTYSLPNQITASIPTKECNELNLDPKIDKIFSHVNVQIEAIPIQTKLDSQSKQHDKQEKRVKKTSRKIGKASKMSKNVLATVGKENNEFQMDRYLFEPSYFRFMWQLQQSSSVHFLLENSSSPNSLLITNADIEKSLTDLVLICNRFNLEVLSRARARSCVHLFFERLEEIVIHDSSRKCVETILTLFSNEIVNISPDNNSQNQTCWLTQMCVLCPHDGTAKAFIRFLSTCIKVLRPYHMERYLEFENTGNDSGSIHSMANIGRADVKRVSSTTLWSSISRLLNKFIIIIEKYHFDQFQNKEGMFIYIYN